MSEPMPTIIGIQQDPSLWGGVGMRTYISAPCTKHI